MTRCPSQRADARCDGQLAGIVAETAEQQADTGGQAAVPVTMLVERVQACLLCSEANGLAPNVSQSDCPLPLACSQTPTVRLQRVCSSGVSNLMAPEGLLHTVLRGRI